MVVWITGQVVPNGEHMNEKYITVQELASLFSVSDSLIYALIREEVIRAVKIGRKNYRISPETVRNLKDGGLLE